MASPRTSIVSVILCAAVTSAACAQNAHDSNRLLGASAAMKLPPALRLLPRASAPAAVTGEPLSFFDDYSTYIKTDYTNVPFSLVPLGGQVNPFGAPWGSSFDFFGAATQEIMQAAGATHPVGDSPTMGPITCFAAAARKTGLDPISNASYGTLGVYSIALLSPQGGKPLVVAQDIYLSSIDNQPRTTVGWGLASTVEGGLFLDRILYGGTDVIDFADNSKGILDRFLDTGRRPDGVGTLFASALHPNFPPPVNEWFTIMAHMSKDNAGEIGYSVWVKSPESVASNPPFIDPRMAAGDIPSVDDNPIGWINIYPGFPDDLATVDVIEGIGLGIDPQGDPSPNSAPLAQAPPPSAVTFDEIVYQKGLDPFNNPNFHPDDFFFANFRASGAQLNTCPPDFNFDGVVNGADLARLLTNWGVQHSHVELSGDDIINGADLAILLTNWGPCPE